MQTGEALIEFDADYIATHAKSLLTQRWPNRSGGDRLGENRYLRGDPDSQPDRVIHPASPAAGSASD